MPDDKDPIGRLIAEVDKYEKERLGGPYLDRPYRGAKDQDPAPPVPPLFPKDETGQLPLPTPTVEKPPDVN